MVELLATLLILALQNGHEAVARLLIDKRAEVNAQDKDAVSSIQGPQCSGDYLLVEAWLAGGQTRNNIILLILQILRALRHTQPSPFRLQCVHSHRK